MTAAHLPGTVAPICNSRAAAHRYRIVAVWSTHCSALFTISHVAGIYGAVPFPATITSAVLKNIISSIAPVSIFAISPLKPSRSHASSKVNVVPSVMVGANVTISLPPVLERRAYRPSSVVPVPLARRKNVGCGPPGLQDVGPEDDDDVVLVVEEDKVLIVELVVKLDDVLEVVREHVPEYVLGIDVHEL